MSDDAVLLLCCRVADAVFATPDSWTIPCEWCHQVCFVDPQALFGENFVNAGSLYGDPVEPVKVRGKRRVCCLRCAGEASKEFDNIDEAGRAHFRAIADRLDARIRDLKSGTRGRRRRR